MTTKPDDVPQDVWAEANRLAGELMLGSDMAFQPENGTDLIAQAIMAAEKRGEEREREAVIAAINELPGMDDADCCGGFEKACEDAIKAIRERK